MKADPYSRILTAARMGKGLRLSADDVWELSMDAAISTRAQVIALGEAPRPQKLTISPTPGGTHD